LAEIATTRSDCSGLAGAAFVDSPVAVVVDAIADFCGYLSAESTGVSQPFVDVAVAVVIDAVTDLHGEKTASAAGIEQTFVRLPVAIVILSVADLHGRTDSAAGSPCSTDTGLLTASALTEGDPAILDKSSLAGAAFVNVSVTVVVGTIADLLRDRTASTTGIELTFVCLPVAIVVLTITDLYARTHAVTQAPLSVRAGLLSDRTDSEILAAGSG